MGNDIINQNEDKAVGPAHFNVLTEVWETVLEEKNDQICFETVFSEEHPVAKLENLRDSLTLPDSSCNELSYISHYVQMSEESTDIETIQTPRQAEPIDGKEAASVLERDKPSQIHIPRIKTNMQEDTHAVFMEMANPLLPEDCGKGKGICSISSSKVTDLPIASNCLKLGEAAEKQKQFSK